MTKCAALGVSVTRSGDNIILNMPEQCDLRQQQRDYLKPAGANTLTGVAMVLERVSENGG